MHYLAQVMEKQKIADLSGELPSVENAASVNVEATKGELNALISGLKLILREAQLAEEGVVLPMEVIVDECFLPRTSWSRAALASSPRTS